jgi:hypothetical protein
MGSSLEATLLRFANFSEVRLRRHPAGNTLGFGKRHLTEDRSPQKGYLVKHAKTKRSVVITTGACIVLVGSLVLLAYRGIEHALASHDLLNAISRRDPVDVDDALRRGADPNTRQSGNKSSDNLVQYLKWLFSKGPHEKSFGPSAFALAAPRDFMHEDPTRSTRIVTLLLQQGADPNARDACGMTVLMWAAFAHNPDIARLLLAHGCRVDAKDPDGRTALWFAANSGSLPIVDALLKKGADINAAGKNSGSPLMGAVWAGQPKTVAYLLKNGADTSVRVIVKDDVKTLKLTALSIAQGGPPRLRHQIVPLLKSHSSYPQPKEE